MLLLLFCTLATRAQVVFYSDINYGGTAISFPVGNYTLANMNTAGLQCFRHIGETGAANLQRSAVQSVCIASGGLYRSCQYW